MSKIVVGLDPSPSSAAALAWAADYARLAGLPLQAVHGMPAPAPIASIGVLGAPAEHPVEEVDPERRRELETLFASVSPEPDWKLTYFIDDPGPAVVAAADGAALIVVGTRGVDARDGATSVWSPTRC